MMENKYNLCVKNAHFIIYMMEGLTEGANVG